MPIGTTPDVLQSSYDRNRQLAVETYLRGISLQQAQNAADQQAAQEDRRLPLYFLERADRLQAQEDADRDKAFQRSLQERALGIQGQQLGIQQQQVGNEAERNRLLYGTRQQAQSDSEFNRLTNLIDRGQIGTEDELLARGAAGPLIQPGQQYSDLRDILATHQENLRQNYLDTAQKSADELNAQFAAQNTATDPASKAKQFIFFATRQLKPGQLKLAEPNYDTQTFTPKKPLSEIPSDLLYLHQPAPSTETPANLKPFLGPPYTPPVTPPPKTAIQSYLEPGKDPYEAIRDALPTPRPTSTAEQYFRSTVGAQGAPQFINSLSNYTSPPGSSPIAPPPLIGPPAPMAPAPRPPVTPPASAARPTSFQTEADARAAGWGAGDIIQLWNPATQRYQRARLD